MQMNFADTTIVLSPNRPLVLRQARGSTLHCVAGQLWLTVEGDADDILLCAGQSWPITRNGLVLVEALGSGSIRLQPKPARRSRLLCWLRSACPPQPDGIPVKA